MLEQNVGDAYKKCAEEMIEGFGHVPSINIRPDPICGSLRSMKIEPSKRSVSVCKFTELIEQGLNTTYGIYVSSSGEDKDDPFKGSHNNEHSLTTGLELFATQEALAIQRYVEGIPK